MPRLPPEKEKLRWTEAGWINQRRYLVYMLFGRGKSKFVKAGLARKAYTAESVP